MFKDYTVPVPDIRGKIYNKKTRLKNGSVSVYVEYEISRTYDRKRKNTSTRRTTIGCRDAGNEGMMFPNDNYYKYIPGAQGREEAANPKRSGCLKAGAYIVIKKIIEDYKLDELLKLSVGEDKTGLFLDLAAYAINCEDNAGQYYPDYAYNHPLFTDDMRIYSDSTVSAFLHRLTTDDRIRFMELWTGRRDKQDKIYMSYDSTSKKSQAGDLEIAEPGESKTGEATTIFNYSLAYDHDNREPLLYEKYPGSINDVSQLESLLGKINGYGYHDICMILDRGYFSRHNIRYMDDSGISFIMMIKGQKALVRSLVLSSRGRFEDRISCHIRKFDVNGMTVKGKLYESDTKDRHFHLFYSPEKYAHERAKLMADLARMEKALDKGLGTEQAFPEIYHRYYELYYREETEEVADRKTGAKETVKRNRLHAYTPKSEVIDEESQLCGYFVIVTSDEMTASEAYIRYKGRDPEEKLFRGDKSYLGNRSMRVYSDESTESKIFIEFVALIIRNKIYLTLLDEMSRTDKRPNYMTVPAALKELNKIELLRLPDGLYRLDHAISAMQKAILKAFGITPAWAKDAAESIGEKVTEYDRKSAASRAARKKEESE